MIENNQQYDSRSSLPWEEKYSQITRVPEEIAKKRMSICLECPLFDKVKNRCYACGCYMKSEVYIASAFCPLGKWEMHVFD